MTIKRISTFAIPLTIVTAYRLVPNRVRGMHYWPGSKGPSTSHLAVSAMYRGVNGWTAIREAIYANGDSTRPPLP